MRIKTLMLGALPAALLLPTLAATSSSAQYYSTSQPELAEKPAIHAPQEAIKLKFLKLDTTPIAKMSESSAVRMACGGAPIQIYQQLPASVRGRSGVPAPVPAPVHVSTSVRGQRVGQKQGMPISTRARTTTQQAKMHTPPVVHPALMPLLVH